MVYWENENIARNHIPLVESEAEMDLISSHGVK